MLAAIVLWIPGAPANQSAYLIRAIVVHYRGSKRALQSKMQPVDVTTSSQKPLNVVKRIKEV